MPVAKPEKLYKHVQRLLDTLNENHKSLKVHNKIDEFYYMQKVEELKQLEESITSAYENIFNTYERLKSLKQNYNIEYTQLYDNWKKDVRWVNRFLSLQNRELEPNQ